MRTVLAATILHLALLAAPAASPNSGAADTYARIVALWTPTADGFLGQPVDDEQQPPDPLAPVLRKQPGEFPEFEMPAPVVARYEPSIFAGNCLGVGLFAGGVAGWIVLGLLVLVLEGKNLPPKAS